MLRCPGLNTWFVTFFFLSVYTHVMNTHYRSNITSLSLCQTCQRNTKHSSFGNTLFPLEWAGYVDLQPTQQFLKHWRFTLSLLPFVKWLHWSWHYFKSLAWSSIGTNFNYIYAPTLGHARLDCRSCVSRLSASWNVGLRLQFSFHACGGEKIIRWYSALLLNSHTPDIKKQPFRNFDNIHNLTSFPLFKHICKEKLISAMTYILHELVNFRRAEVRCLHAVTFFDMFHHIC